MYDFLYFASRICFPNIRNIVYDSYESVFWFAIKINAKLLLLALYFIGLSTWEGGVPEFITSKADKEADALPPPPLSTKLCGSNVIGPSVGRFESGGTRGWPPHSALSAVRHGGCCGRQIVQLSATEPAACSCFPWSASALQFIQCKYTIEVRFVG